MNKFLFLLLTLVSFSTLSIAQNSSLTIFSEDGHPFILLINGIQQNEQPMANVRAERLEYDFYSVKVNFTQKSLKSVEAQEISLKDADGGSIDAMYVLRKVKKGKFALQLYSSFPAKDIPMPAIGAVEDEEEVAEPQAPTTEKTAKEAVAINSKAMAIKEKDDFAKKKADVVAMLEAKMDEGMKTDDKKQNVEVIKDVDVKIDGNKKTTTTTITTITTTGRSVQRDVLIDVQTEYISKGKVKGSLDNKTPAGTGCRGAQLVDSDFDDSKKNIASKTTEKEKLAVAKQIASIACLTSDQVKEIMFLFSEEETKLNFAKFAYSRTVNTGNYSDKVAVAFRHAITKEQLKKHISM